MTADSRMREILAECLTARDLDAKWLEKWTHHKDKIPTAGSIECEIYDAALEALGIIAKEAREAGIESAAKLAESDIYLRYDIADKIRSLSHG